MANLEPQSVLTCSTAIQNLFAYVESLSGRLLQAEDELCDKNEMIKWNRDRIEEVKKQIQDLQLEKVRFLASALAFTEANFSRLDMPSLRF
jgi:uncharacterized protein YbcI